LEKTKTIIMKFKKNNFLIVGFQKGAIKNLVFIIKNIYKRKVKVLDSNFFDEIEVEKKVYKLDRKNFKKILKYKDDYNIILGTSEKKLEVNLANFCFKNKIDFYFYIDSITNIKKRFNSLDFLPSKIICFDKTVINQTRKEIKKINKKTHIYNLNMPFQNYLKKKYSNIKRKNKSILYLSSFLGIKIEKKYINYLIKTFKHISKIYISIHPRDKKYNWINYFRKNKKIKIFNKREFYSNKNVSKVYGVSTMGLINYKFAGFDVYYFKNAKLSRSPFIKFIKKYKIKKFIR